MGKSLNSILFRWETELKKLRALNAALNLMSKREYMVLNAEFQRNREVIGEMIDAHRIVALKDKKELEEKGYDFSTKEIAKHKAACSNRGLFVKRKRN